MRNSRTYWTNTGFPVFCPSRRSLWVVGCMMVVVLAMGMATAQADRIQDLIKKPEKLELNLEAKQAALDSRRVWKFDHDTAGQVPGGFSVKTLGKGAPGLWVVTPSDDAQSIPNVVRQEGGCTDAECLQVLLADDVTYDYVELSFRMRGASPSPGIGGAVINAKDSNNFYAVLVDLSANTLSVVRVLNGEKTVLGSGPITQKKTNWHSLRVQRNTIISKDFMETFFDHKLAVSVEDQSLGEGHVGFVTNGDGAIEFDTFHAIRIYSQTPTSSPAAY